MASSPIKKSRSSVPLLALRLLLGPAPPVRKEGLFATAGRPDPVPPPAAPFVAIAVGKTNEGESLPAKPAIYVRSSGGSSGVTGLHTQFRETGAAATDAVSFRPQHWDVGDAGCRLTCP